MKNFCVFEAGGTKTNLWVWENGIVKKYALAGYNPNREREPFVEALRDVGESLKEKDVYFYGAGLSSTQNIDYTTALLKDQGASAIQLFGDLLGAARALLADANGVFGIMGTGGVAAYFKEGEICNRRGGHGFLIDDLGGGFDLGQGMMKLWLDGDLGIAVEQEIESRIAQSKTSLLDELYQSKNIQLVSDMALIAKSFEQHPPVHQLIRNKMTLFVQQNVMPLCKIHNSSEFSAVGSIAHYFEGQLKEALTSNGLQLKKVIHRPIEHLFQYHLNVKKSNLTDN